VFSALSSAALDRLRTSPHVRHFLDGVNAAAVALIAIVLVMLGRVAFDGVFPVAIAMVAGAVIFAARVNPAWVLLAAAAIGASSGLLGE
jgi:chromate transporter